MNRFIFSIALFSLLLFCMQPTGKCAETESTPEVAAGASAEKPSVDKIVAKANHIAYYQGRDGRADVEMTIIDQDGKERSRQFTILRRDVEVEDDSPVQAGDQKFYVYFKRPADWNKTVFMVHKKVDGDDDRWLYLPGLDLVKRIAASDKRTSFVGSHFLYEDVSGRNPNEDRHELSSETEDAYVLKNTPKNPETVEFSYYLMYVHKKTFLPYYLEYYNSKGEKYRVGRAVSTETIDGYLTVTKGEMEDLNTGGKTVVTYSKVKYNTDLPDDIFTERYLRNPPRKELR
ncbi:MAG: outer membrane lipoprotein-sorting protein [Planctomycetes bacterium]|nr:outer membrane lipoprotein-sorting protein [Planctomycetota bacterium]